MKKYFEKILCAFMFYSLSFSTYANINCGSPKDDAEKNYCLTKDRNMERQGDTWEDLGMGAVETLTIGVNAISTIGVKKNNKQSPSYTCSENPLSSGLFANIAPRKATPLALRLGGLAMIIQEIYGYFTIKKNCDKYLNMSITALKDELKDAPMAQQFCTEENIKLIKNEDEKGTFISFCKAQACVSQQLKAAKTKAMIQGVSNGIYLGAAAYETAYAVILTIWGLARTAIDAATDAAKCTVGYAACYAAEFANKMNTKWCAYIYQYIYTDDVDNVKFLVMNKSADDEKFIVDHSIKQLNKQLLHSKSDLDATLLLSEHVRASSGAKSSITLSQYEFLKSEKEKFKGVKSLLTDAVSAVANSFVPSAKADYNVQSFANDLGMVAGVGSVLFTGTKKSVKKVVENGYKVPMYRIAYTGAMYGLGVAVKSHFENNVVKELEKRVASFDEKMVPFLPELPPIPTVTIPPMPTMPGGVPTPPAFSQFDQFCTAGSGGFDEKCKCLKDKSCLQISELPEIRGSELDQSEPAGITAIENAMSSGKSVVNDLAKGNLSNAYKTAAGSSSNISALNNFNKKMRHKLNELLVQNKQRPIDFDKNEKKMLADMLSATKADLQSAGVKTNQMASIPLNPVEKNIKDEKVVSEAVTSSETKNVNLNKKDIGDNLKLAEEESSMFNNDAVLDEANKSGVGDLSIPTEDINKKPEENIFKTISSRYTRSAYPRFFKEVKK